jgi:hypothetical protein
MSLVLHFAMIVFRVLTPLLAGTPLRHRSSHSLQRTLVQILATLLPCSLRRRQYKDIDTTCSYMEIPLLRQVCFERALHFFCDGVSAALHFGEHGAATSHGLRPQKKDVI